MRHTINMAVNPQERVFAALKAGAVGYLLKNVSPDDIRATVERAAAGEPMLSGEIAGRVLREFERERQEDRYREQLAALTARELEVARLVVDRKTNSEIAAELFLSQKTVETHLRNIFNKMGVATRVALAHAVERADEAPSARPR